MEGNQNSLMQTKPSKMRQTLGILIIIVIIIGIGGNCYFLSKYSYREINSYTFGYLMILQQLMLVTPLLYFSSFLIVDPSNRILAWRNNRKTRPFSPFILYSIGLSLIFVPAQSYIMFGNIPGLLPW